MSQDEIMEMWNSITKYAPSEVRIAEFANLVAAKEQKKWQDQTAVEIHEAVLEEREACAKVCDARAIEYDGFTEEQNASEKLATAIRARGEA
jgi:hypothetical protein